MALQLARRPFTAAEYHRLIEAGILTEDDRVELLDGEIIQMGPIGPRHAGCVNRLTDFLTGKLRKVALMCVQNPIQLSEYSEPEPDICVVRRPDFYSERHPSPADVLIAIEVADTTVESDWQVKLSAYARAGIPEAWLVDLVGDRVEVQAGPGGGLYQEVRYFRRGQRVASGSIPQLKLKVDDILGQS